jgi:N-acetyl-anhydromuramyl-L-alanine amidase AmpD
VPPGIDDPNYDVVAADSNHRGGTRPLPPRVVVMHATAGTNSLAWLTTDPNSAVSAHLLIDKDGDVHRLVEDAGVAYHAGVSQWSKFGGPGQPSVNWVSLGIELENLNSGSDPYPTAQVLSAARAVYRWWGAYGYLPTVSHMQIAPTRKTDPAGFPWGLYQTYLDQLVQGTIT